MSQYVVSVESSYLIYQGLELFIFCVDSLVG